MKANNAPGYLATFRDGAGRWLDGAKTYELLIDPDLPAPGFWSVVLYEDDTRCFIENAQGKTGVNSRLQLAADEDGAVRLHTPTTVVFGDPWKVGDIKEVT